MLRWCSIEIRYRDGFSPFCDPLTSNTYGLLFALPGWAGSEQVACFDLTEVDGRLFADNVPLVTNKLALLRLAALPPDSAVDVYIGSSAVPVGPDEEVELRQWTCLFFVPSFDLPGPYFWLPDTLLSSASWMPDIVLPAGPDLPCMCVVHDSGHRFLDFGSEAAFGRLDIIASEFGLRPGGLLLQPARPQLTDVSLTGRHCRGVYIVSSADSTFDDEAGDRVLAVVDCRAMLQGWYAIEAIGDSVPCLELEQVLSTFAPPAWSLYLERLPRDGSVFRVHPGAVAFASFVPNHGRSASTVEVDEHAESEAHTVDDELSAEDMPMLGPVAPRAGSRSRSRSPLVIPKMTLPAEHGTLMSSSTTGLSFLCSLLNILPKLFGLHWILACQSRMRLVQSMLNATASRHSGFQRFVRRRRSLSFHSRFVSRRPPGQGMSLWLRMHFD